MARRVSISRILSFVTLCCALAAAASDIINFVEHLSDQLTHHFALEFWLLSVDIVLLCALLALGSLVGTERIFQYFGFLRYPLGTGMLLIFIGTLVVGMAGTFGWVTGIACMAWGLISCAIHFATERGSQAPTNEPLLPS